MRVDHPISVSLMSIMFPLFQLIKSEFKQAFARSPITMTQFRIVMLVRMGVEQVGKAAELLDVSQPAASKMIDALVRNGYLKRVPNPEDRRAVLLTPTAKGVRAVDALRLRVLGKIGGEILRLSQADQEIIQDGVVRLAGVLARVAAISEAASQGKEAVHAR